VCIRRARYLGYARARATYGGVVKLKFVWVVAWAGGFPGSRWLCVGLCIGTTLEFSHPGASVLGKFDLQFRQ
jgi:hypothetical protein